MRRTATGVMICCALAAALLWGAPAAHAVNCSITSSSTSVTGFCGRQGVSLTVNGNSISGFVGRKGVSLTQNGNVYSGFVGRKGVSLTQNGNVTTGFVGRSFVTCFGPGIPVACLA